MPLGIAPPAPSKLKPTDTVLAYVRAYMRMQRKYDDHRADCLSCGVTHLCPEGADLRTHLFAKKQQFESVLNELLKTELVGKKIVKRPDGSLGVEDVEEA